MTCVRNAGTINWRSSGRIEFASRGPVATNSACRRRSAASWNVIPIASPLCSSSVARPSSSICTRRTLRQCLDGAARAFAAVGTAASRHPVMHVRKPLAETNERTNSSKTAAEATSPPPQNRSIAPTILGRVPNRVKRVKSAVCSLMNSFRTAKPRRTGVFSPGGWTPYINDVYIQFPTMRRCRPGPVCVAGADDRRNRKT